MLKNLNQMVAAQAHREILAAFELMIDNFQGAKNEASNDPKFRFSEELEKRHKQAISNMSAGLDWLDAMRDYGK